MKGKTVYNNRIAHSAVYINLFCISIFVIIFIGTSSDPVEAMGNEDFGIPDFCSSVDMDGDGIDDQTDNPAGSESVYRFESRI